MVIALLWGSFLNFPMLESVNANNQSFTEFRNVDKNTFNEYRYKLTKEFLAFEQRFSIDEKINSNNARRIINLTKQWYKYLPDNLINESLQLKLVTALEKGIKYPEDEYNYEEIKKGIKSFISDVNIEKITWTIDATPTEWNAPLVTTLRADVVDPSGVSLPKSAYVWWMDFGNNRREVIWIWPLISKRFTQEWNFTVFLDVKSSHKNKFGNSDVIPYSWKIEIQVKEKIASVVLRISWKNISSNDEIKFSPEEAKYWLIFDATSSVPSTWTRFIKTYWDFGNWVQKSYNGRPKIERVVYVNEWDYDVTLKLKTNRGRVVEKKFKVFVHNPVAVIDASNTEWYMWDNFIFQTKSYGWNKNLRFIWEIYDIDREKTILKKSWSRLNYSFKNKWRFSLQLKITDNAWNVWIDTKTIYINSKPPVADFKTSIPLSNKPNEVYFDATSTFDPDHWDDWHLRYYWTIDGMKVNLEKSNDNWSTWFYTFDSIWEHSVALEVEDPDWITNLKKSTVNIKSILSLDFLAAPRVVQRDKKIRFLANSKLAKFYEWDFWDWEEKSLESNKTSHSYQKSWIYTVTLKVRWNNSDSNTLSKQVYIWDSKNPVAILDIWRWEWGFKFKKEKWVCSWNDAYIISRADSINLTSSESIDTSGLTSGLSVSWKIGDRYIDKKDLVHKFDELWCFPIKLTVKSNKDKTKDTRTTWVKVINLKPKLLDIKVDPIDTETDPVIVNVKTVWDKDVDWVIKSYLWYYTTDLDSDPQDFKMTRKWSTTFVVPKIPWNYHFWVILKDNNEAKTNSEDVIWKNTLEINWDNSNTPIIDFSVSDSSIAIWDMVNFKVKATNILWRSIEKTSKFFWDFDWDWFYEKETDSSKISYRYKKSGVFYAKVKVTNKWFSNTRIITINVVNRLISNFDYLSIWDKYVFIDKSKWSIDNYKWDLWDWKETQNKTKFVHEYEDNRPIHTVELTVTEWTKIKKIKKRVKRDSRNVSKINNDWLNIFSFPWFDSDWKIVLNKEESVFVYLWESKWDFSNYAIDYDIDSDSNLNWWKDDDVDNEHNLSFKKWDPDEITLNKKRLQTVRAFLLDIEWNTVDSKDIVIEKLYIKEEKEPELWPLDGVSDDVKLKIENLKFAIKELPQEYRIQGLKYIEKLQDNWKDETEKVRTIMEFQDFIDTTWVDNIEEIIVLIDALLLKEWDKWDKALYYAASKWLIPKDIECKTSWESCKVFLDSKIDQINNSDDIENNRKLWSEILKVVAVTSLMNEKEKNDFKAVLKLLIYSSLGDIPGWEVDEVIAGDEQSWKNTPTKVEPIWSDSSWEEGWDDWKLMSFLKTVWKWSLWILWVLIVWMFVFWILDFIKNRKTWESFEDFVDNKSWDEDVLWDVLSDKEEVDPLASGWNTEKKSWVFSEEPKKETKVSPDPLSSWNEIQKETQVFTPPEIKKEDNLNKNNDWVVPDWLWTSGDSDVLEKTNTKEVKNNDISNNTDEDNTSLEEENVWFSLSDWEELKDNKASEVKKEEIEQDIDLEEETKLEEEKVPDWLKESATKDLPKKSTETEEEFLEKNKYNFSEEKDDKKENEPIVLEDKEEEKIDLENDVPDWLKWPSDNIEEEKIEKTEDIKNKEVKVVEDLDEINQDKVDKEEENNKKEKKDKPEIISSDDNIPDWLKWSIDFNNESEIKEDKENNEKEDKKTKNESKSRWNEWDKWNLDEADVPDWLKDSLSDNTKEDKKEKKSKTKKDDDIDMKNNKNDDLNKDKDAKKDELWDSDVNVPDWLKEDSDK